MDVAAAEQVLALASDVLPPPAELTLFSIGTRGYYENPTSDVLSFYLDPDQVHGFGDRVLRALFLAINVKPPDSLRLFSRPLRELRTEAGNRLDVVIVGDDWVLVIENKLFSSEANPFEDYCHHLARAYPDKKLHRVLLSPRTGGDIPRWTRLTYRALISSIRNNVEQQLLGDRQNKWAVFFTDFLLHLETEATRMDIEAKHVQFIENHYSEIVQLNRLVEDYHAFVVEEGRNAITDSLGGDPPIRTKVGVASPAIRFYVEPWGHESNVVIIADPGRSGLRFFIQIYTRIEDRTITTNASTFASNLTYWIEAGGSWRCWKSTETWTQRQEVMKKLGELSVAFDRYIRTVPPT